MTQTNPSSTAKPQNIKTGLTIATCSLLFYSPLAAYLTSHSIAAKSISQVYNCNSLQVSALNSIAFALSVGLGPLSSICFNNKHLGIYRTTILGYLIATIGLFLSYGFAQSFFQLLLTYSIITSIGNNFIYMGLNCMVEGWLSGTKWLTTGAVLVSGAISLGTFAGNTLSAQLQIYIHESVNQQIKGHDEDHAFNFEKKLFFSENPEITTGTAGTGSQEIGKSVLTEDILFARRRFFLAGVIIFCVGCLFAIVGRDPPSGKNQTKSKEEPSSSESQEMMSDEEKKLTARAENSTSESRNTNTENSSSSLLKAAISPPVIAWFFATFCWGMIFTVPYTLGKDYIKDPLVT